MKINIKALMIGIFFVVLLSFISTKTIFAENVSSPHDVIRVGYVDINGFFFEEADGTYAGIGFEMLQEIAMYTGWDYEYVCASLEDSLRMLEEGSIDLFFPMQKTKERLLQYEYSSESICKNQAVVLTKPDADYCYNEFERINGMCIGTIKGNHNNELLQQYLENNGCSVVFNMEFASTTELLQALEEGRVDGVLTASDRNLSNCKIILTLPEVDSYVIAAKGNRSVLDRFNDALEQMKMNTPNIENTLDAKYREVRRNVTPSFTRAEKEYIENKGSVKVLAGNKDYDEIKNISKSNIENILSKLSDITGITFTVESREDTSAIYRALAMGEADMMFVFNHDYYWAQENNVWLSKIYEEIPNYSIRKSGTKEIKTIAVIKDSYTHYQLDKQNKNILFCSSVQEGIEAVLKGKADLVYANELVANYYSAFPKYNRLSFTASYEFVNEYSVAVSKCGDIELISIINKAISCLDTKEFDNMFTQRVNIRNYSLIDFFYTNPIMAVVMISIMTAMLVLILSLFSFASVSKKKNYELENAYAAKSDFLSHMSHDMRTPMNSIIGLSSLSQDQDTDIDCMRDYMKKIKLSGEYLLGLINDVLDMTKLENEKVFLNLSVVNLEEYYLEIDTIIRQRTIDKGIDYAFILKGCKDRYAKFDKLRVEQIIINLLSNAIKFTPSGGKVACIIESILQEDDTILNKITIQDNGIGISEDFIPKLFLPFEQERSEITTMSTGTGLGLSIVKNLVDLMDGKISVTSKKGVGTEFLVELMSQRVDNFFKEEEKKIRDTRWIFCWKTYFIGRRSSIKYRDCYADSK